jgi:outer membrane protein insertion porin family
LTIVENSKAYIERIDIRGNEVTKDKVIRRVLSLEPGDAFDAEAVNRDKMRIYNLGFFENVAVDTQPGSEMDKLILIFDVSPERKTGTLSLGAGYSSVEGLVGFLQVSQNNLFGNGQAVSAQWDFGDRKSSYSLSFTEPWLLDRPISFGVDVYRILRTQAYNSQGFDQISTGGSLRLGYSFQDSWNAWKLYNTYRYQSDETSNVSPNLVGILAGVENISSITPSVVRDTRDNIFDASRGSYNILSLTLAGGYLGGDKHFIKPVYDVRMHFQTPAIFGWQWLNRFVLGLHGRVGYATPYDAGTGTGTVPVSERFFMGGTDTVRGYLERSLGGEVAFTGGLFTLLSNVEYGFKPAPPIKLRAFYDSGNVWSNIDAVNWDSPYLYPSAGFGMLFTIPTSVIQIRLDWGYPLVKVPTQVQEGRIHFNIGNIF